MLFLFTSILVVGYIILALVTRPYRNGKKPFTFSTVVDVPANKVEQVYEQVRGALPSFMNENHEFQSDGSILLSGHVPFVDGPSDVVQTRKCKRIGGTDMFPIYRLIEVDGKPYAGSNSHYAVSAFAPHGDQTILTIEERCSQLSIFGFFELRFVLKRILAAQVRMLKQLTNLEGEMGDNVGTATGSDLSSLGSSVSPFQPANVAHKNDQTQVNADKTSSATWAPGSAGSSVATRRNRDFLERHKNDLILSILAVASFMFMFGFEGGLLLAPLILLHEYGHLLGFQLTGQKGNRLMLVPFFGGLAIANEAHKTEFNRAFCALMGPGICAPASIALAVAAVSVGDHWSWWWFAYAAMLCGMGNALNMVPMMPFDGGHIMQSVARSLSHSQAHAAMMVMSAGGGLILMQAGYETFAYITFAWLAAAAFQTDGGGTNPESLNLKGGLIIAGMYAVVLACHVGAALFVYGRFY